MTFVPSGVGKPGDAGFCHELRGFRFQLTSLVHNLSETLRQLSGFDGMNHDEVIEDEELLRLTQDWRVDHAKSAIILAHLDLRKSHRYLVEAHNHVKGLFKGKLRDETEEALARAIKGSEARMNRFEGVLEEYEPPNRPFEIRRNALSYLIVRCQELVVHFEKLIKGCDELVSEDLLAQVVQSKDEIENLAQRMSTLRERCSQSMESNLTEFLDQVTIIAQVIDDVELEAGVRSGCWYGDYKGRLAEKELNPSN